MKLRLNQQLLHIFRMHLAAEGLKAFDFRVLDEVIKSKDGSGYVLDFTDSTFSQPFQDELCVNIDNKKYLAKGRGKRIICMDGLDLNEIFQRRRLFTEVLYTKVRKAVETGHPLVSVRHLFINESQPMELLIGIRYEHLKTEESLEISDLEFVGNLN